MARPFKITEVWAAIATESYGDEGVPAIMIGNSWYPLIAADATRFEFIRTEAQKLAEQKGIEVKVVRFTTMETVQVFQPKNKLN